jgi:hypothetical protein
MFQDTEERAGRPRSQLGVLRYTLLVVSGVTVKMPSSVGKGKGIQTDVFTPSKWREKRVVEGMMWTSRTFCHDGSALYWHYLKELP